MSSAGYVTEPDDDGVIQLNGQVVPMQQALAALHDPYGNVVTVSNLATEDKQAIGACIAYVGHLVKQAVHAEGIGVGWLAVEAAHQNAIQTGWQVLSAAAQHSDRQLQTWAAHVASVLQITDMNHASRLEELAELCQQQQSAGFAELYMQLSTELAGKMTDSQQQNALALRQFVDQRVSFVGSELGEAHQMLVQQCLRFEQNVQNELARMQSQSRVMTCKARADAHADASELFRASTADTAAAFEAADRISREQLTQLKKMVDVQFECMAKRLETLDARVSDTVAANVDFILKQAAEANATANSAQKMANKSTADAGLHVKRLENAIDQLKTMVNEVIEKASSTREELRAEHSKAQSESLSTQETIKRLRASLERRTREDSPSIINNAVDDAVARHVAALELRVTKAETSVTSMKKDVDALKKQLATVEKSVTVMKEVFMTDLASLQTTCHALDGDVSLLRAAGQYGDAGAVKKAIELALRPVLERLERVEGQAKADTGAAAPEDAVLEALKPVRERLGKLEKQGTTVALQAKAHASLNEHVLSIDRRVVSVEGDVKRLKQEGRQDRDETHVQVDEEVTRRLAALEAEVKRVRLHEGRQHAAEVPPPTPPRDKVRVKREEVQLGSDESTSSDDDVEIYSNPRSDARHHEQDPPMPPEFQQQQDRTTEGLDPLVAALEVPQMRFAYATKILAASSAEDRPQLKTAGVLESTFAWDSVLVDQGNKSLDAVWKFYVTEFKAQLPCDTPDHVVRQATEINKQLLRQLKLRLRQLQDDGNQWMTHLRAGVTRKADLVAAGRVLIGVDRYLFILFAVMRQARDSDNKDLDVKKAVAKFDSIYQVDTSVSNIAVAPSSESFTKEHKPDHKTDQAAKPATSAAYRSSKSKETAKTGESTKPADPKGNGN